MSTTCTSWYIYYIYISFNGSQPVWCAYAEVVNAIGTNINDVDTISVDAIGVDTNVVDVIVTSLLQMPLAQMKSCTE